MNSTRSEAAWSHFWATGGAGPASGCLPGALRGIDAAQRQVWAAVAHQLPPKAEILDLATGDGAVLAKLRAARPDLQLTGIDSAASLPNADEATSLRSGVAMENLPFAAGSFDLVTSQFGFEYGDRHVAASEVGRVLRRGGGLEFLVHHAESPIVEHNVKRRAGLWWAVSESGLLDKARALARLRTLTPLPTPDGFREGALQARQLFPTQPVAEEFSQAILQTLEMGRHRPAKETLEVLNELESRARNELARIDALFAAACSADHISLIMARFRQLGFDILVQDEVREGADTRPFAWHLSGTKIAP